MYNHRIVVTNTGQGRPCLCRWRAAQEQLPDLGHSLTGRQSGQAAPQASNYHWIAAWQVFQLLPVTSVSDPYCAVIYGVHYC